MDLDSPPSKRGPTKEKQQDSLQKPSPMVTIYHSVGPGEARALIQQRLFWPSDGPTLFAMERFLSKRSFLQTIVGSTALLCLQIAPSTRHSRSIDGPPVLVITVRM